MLFGAILAIFKDIRALLFFGCFFTVGKTISFTYFGHFQPFTWMHCISTALAMSAFLLVSFLLAWEWFSPKRRGLMSGMVVSLQCITTALVVFLQLVVIESKDMIQEENSSVKPGATDYEQSVDTYQKSVSERLV